MDMIPKLICWIFGHKRILKYPTGETYYHLGWRYAIHDRKRLDFCLRCGRKL